MREIINNTLRNLEYDEHMAILQCTKILQEAFKRKVFSISINANNADRTDVYGVSFVFDINSIGAKRE